MKTTVLLFSLLGTCTLAVQQHQARNHALIRSARNAQESDTNHIVRSIEVAHHGVSHEDLLEEESHEHEAQEQPALSTAPLVWPGCRSNVCVSCNECFQTEIATPACQGAITTAKAQIQQQKAAAASTAPTFGHHSSTVVGGPVGTLNRAEVGEDEGKSLLEPDSTCFNPPTSGSGSGCTQKLMSCFSDDEQDCFYGMLCASPCTCSSFRSGFRCGSEKGYRQVAKKSDGSDEECSYTAQDGSLLLEMASRAAKSNTSGAAPKSTARANRADLLEKSLNDKCEEGR